MGPRHEYMTCPIPSESPLGFFCTLKEAVEKLPQMLGWCKLAAIGLSVVSLSVAGDCVNTSGTDAASQETRGSGRLGIRLWGSQYTPGSWSMLHGLWRLPLRMPDSWPATTPMNWTLPCQLCLMARNCLPWRWAHSTQPYMVALITGEDLKLRGKMTWSRTHRQP